MIEKTSLPTLFVVGGESLSLEIRETAELHRNKYESIFNVVAPRESCIYPYVSDDELEELLPKIEDARYIVGFSNLALKQKFYKLFEKYHCVLENIIHPSALISPTASIGCGNYIGGNTVLSTSAIIGNCNIINYNVTIGHDAIIGNNCVLNPGCRISGHDRIGDNCLIGANAFVFQGVEISHDCLIDALAYIRKDIKEPSICFGGPVQRKFPNNI